MCVCVCAKGLSITAFRNCEGRPCTTHADQKCPVEKRTIALNFAWSSKLPPWSPPDGFFLVKVTAQGPQENAIARKCFHASGILH